MPVSEETYKRVALEDVDELWEFVCGHLVAKPPMTTSHNYAARMLLVDLIQQLDRREFVVTETAKLRVPNGNHRIPDVCVIPMELLRRRLRVTEPVLEVFEDPMPFVAEVWSPSIGRYDVDEKFPEYRQRGDREIWRLHPYDRTVIAWLWQPDGSYCESHFQGGQVRLHVLPDVAIDLDTLFA